VDSEEMRNAYWRATQDEKCKLLKGDCLKLLPTIPDCSIDAIVTDPPYELGFMGKSWDSSGIAYSVDLWRECLRVLKPGGHLLSFGGSRTYHRMTCAIEDAGFEIRDQIMWIYGSGFPKSLNVSKSIEAKLVTGSANKTAFKKLSGERIERGNWGIAKQQFVHGQRDTNYDETAGDTRLGELNPTTDEAKQWSGWGTALKPAHEPIVMARKPLIGTVAQNVLKYGTGAINIDATRVPHLSEVDRASATPQGRVTNNRNAGAAPDLENGGRHDVVKPDTSLGRFPANVIHDGSEEVLELFGKPARFFYSAKASKAERNTGLEQLPTRTASAMGYEKGLGNASEGMFKDHNPQKQKFHPTVKPLALMRYLVRLVTPPEGKVLDPFAGSGTTLVAALHENFFCIGIEITEDYWSIIEGRIKHVQRSNA
jgi:DNA modification methylase